MDNKWFMNKCEQIVVNQMPYQFFKNSYLEMQLHRPFKSLFFK